ncbi:angiotensin-converting enzyme-like isoform X2, partial [Biomphalaria pfeifferi]
LAVIMASSRDYCYRSKVWTAYRNAAGGKKMRDLYSDFVELANDAYRVLGYEDMRHNWISAYESETFEEDILKLHNKLRPLYVQLHAYVRRKLKARYGEDKFPSSGHIPAHILGDMWAQDWSTLIEDMRPYPNLSTFDLTNEMIRQNYTVLKMVQAADNFFQSLGLKAMPPRFWEKSLFESPTDGRQVACHAEAVDFRNRRDYRIRMCATVTMADLETIYHEMGHIQYFLQYAHQPYLSRISPHTGFHEAVGDTIALSAMTPHNLYSIGLLNQPFDDPQSELNYLMLMALRRISLIPPSFLVDQWRWKVFRGEITKENYNKEWWNFKCKYQGIYPPVTRLSEDFDAGSIYHISHNVNYISYFLSFVLQFQFHKALCEAAGFDGPLHRCNIYNSTRAGTKLSEMLRHGATQTWQKSLRVLTGTNRMDAQPLLDYFEPLMEYLKNENLEDIDWQPNCPLNNN